MKAITAVPGNLDQVRVGDLPDPSPARQRIITRRVAMEGFAATLHKNDDDVRAVVDQTIHTRP